MENKLVVTLPQEMEQELRGHYNQIVRETVESALQNDSLKKTFYRSKEICNMFHISQPTLRAWRKQGLKVVIVDKSVFYSIDSVESWLKEHEQ